MATDPLRHRFEHDSVKQAVDLLVDRWTFLILREAFFGVRRFGELQRNLGIARTVLSARLKQLVAEGMLERVPYREDPVWFEYRLTEKGLEFYPVALALMAWGDRHLAGPAGPPLVLRHRRCGELAGPRWVCASCGEDLHARDVQPEPGPGARP
ncbi:MAG TPA: helix-turn-helix domain-containing protein [Solirubrobacteraceae bacterium]|jgi:DNA-binding HxlR family transcriptional regulator|nr:helix-turn-helix domain-containing protein [Solirubrobacteraceae bacterium]